MEFEILLKIYNLLFFYVLFNIIKTINFNFILGKRKEKNK